MTDEGETGYCYCSCARALRDLRGRHARPDPPSIPIGPGLTEDKPQSKLWYTDNADRTVTWWGILGFVGDATAAPGVYFYKLENGVLVRQAFPDALVDVNIEARADVLWNGPTSLR